MGYERILLDMEIQKDFFCRSGRFYSKANGQVLKHVKELLKWAKIQRIPVISTLLRASLCPPGREHLTYCIEGTEGELRVPRTVLPNHIAFGTRRTTDLPESILDRYSQVIFEKRSLNILSNLRIERLLTQLSGSGTFILCGAGVAGGIVQAAVTLRSRKFSVILADDAAADLGDPSAEMARRRMAAKGVIFCPTATIIAPPLTPKRKNRFRNSRRGATSRRR
ncbi:MAG: isochorismatase family protein [Phycisphaerae bacterium]|jgi:nicotinamidase-related amidase|nr:isochorismatase family protein [Phycisphaerae bacterium]